MKRIMWVLLPLLLFSCTTRTNEYYKGTFYDSIHNEPISLDPYFFSHALVESIFANFDLPDVFSSKETAELCGRFYYYAQQMDGVSIEIDSYPGRNSLYINMRPTNLETLGPFRPGDDMSQLGYLFWFNVEYKNTRYRRYSEDEFNSSNEMGPNTLAYLYRLENENRLVRATVDYSISDENSMLDNIGNCIQDGLANNDYQIVTLLDELDTFTSRYNDPNGNRVQDQIIHGIILNCEYHIMQGKYDRARELLQESKEEIDQHREYISQYESGKVTIIDKSIEQTSVSLLLTEFFSMHQ